MAVAGVKRSGTLGCDPCRRPLVDIVHNLGHGPCVPHAGPHSQYLIKSEYNNRKRNKYSSKNDSMASHF